MVLTTGARHNIRGLNLRFCGAFHSLLLLLLFRLLRLFRLFRRFRTSCGGRLRYGSFIYPVSWSLCFLGRHFLFTQSLSRFRCKKKEDEYIMYSVFHFSLEAEHVLKLVEQTHKNTTAGLVASSYQWAAFENLHQFFFLEILLVLKFTQI